MSNFLKYDKATAINSFNGVRGTARRVILSRVDNPCNLIPALIKYKETCLDMELAVERLVYLDPANSEEYFKVLKNKSKEREDIDKHVNSNMPRPNKDNLASKSSKINFQLNL